MTDSQPSSLASLIKAIHSAGIHTDQWPEVLERLRCSLGARVVTLGRHEFTTGADSMLFESPGGDFGEHLSAYAARNPWFLSSADYVAGRVMTGDDLVSAGDLRRTDFYRGFLRPRGLLHRICAVVAQRGCGAVLLSAYRGEDHAAFGASERAQLQDLLDHITLSLESLWRWQEADDLARALLLLLEQDGNPIALVTADGELIYRNAAAQPLFDRAFGLRLDGRFVIAASPPDRRPLREAIAQVARGPSDAADAGPTARVVTLACAQLNRPVVVVARPAGPVFLRESGMRRGLVMLTLRTGYSVHDPARCGFARLYELTDAQARVSGLIFAGRSLSTIAQSLNVSENTVRSHLRQIFQKTSTHGQMELVHLHARVCTSLF